MVAAWSSSAPARISNLRRKAAGFNNYTNFEARGLLPARDAGSPGRFDTQPAIDGDGAPGVDLHSHPVLKRFCKHPPRLIRCLAEPPCTLTTRNLRPPSFELLGVSIAEYRFIRR